MRRVGDDPNAIAPPLLGHSQATTTKRFYGHVDLEAKLKAIEVNPPLVITSMTLRTALVTEVREL